MFGIDDVLAALGSVGGVAAGGAGAAMGGLGQIGGILGGSLGNLAGFMGANAGNVAQLSGAALGQVAPWINYANRNNNVTPTPATIRSAGAGYQSGGSTGGSQPASQVAPSTTKEPVLSAANTDEQSMLEDRLIRLLAQHQGEFSQDPYAKAQWLSSMVG